MYTKRFPYRWLNALSVGHFRGSSLRFFLVPRTRPAGGSTTTEKRTALFLWRCIATSPVKKKVWGGGGNYPLQKKGPFSWVRPGHFCTFFTPPSYNIRLHDESSRKSRGKKILRRRQENIYRAPKTDACVCVCVGVLFMSFFVFSSFCLHHRDTGYCWMLCYGRLYNALLRRISTG